VILPNEDASGAADISKGGSTILLYFSRKKMIELKKK
jgi:hypothetical protein